MGMDFVIVEPPKAGSSETSTYRLTIQAMAAVRAVLAEAGVLSNGPPPQPPPVPHGIHSQKKLVNAALAGDRSALEALPLPYAQFVTALQGARSARSPRAGQVPSFKFESNSEWRVMPEECRLLARTLRKQAASLTPEGVERANLAAGAEHEVYFHSPFDQGWSTAELAEMLLGWASFNEVAAERGGYYVT